MGCLAGSAFIWAGRQLGRLSWHQNGEHVVIRMAATMLHVDRHWYWHININLLQLQGNLTRNPEGGDGSGDVAMATHHPAYSGDVIGWLSVGAKLNFCKRAAVENTETMNLFSLVLRGSGCLVVCGGVSNIERHKSGIVLLDITIWKLMQPK